MVPDGIQREDLCKIHSNSGDKKTSGVAAETKLNEIHGSKYRISLHHQILDDHGVSITMPFTITSFSKRNLHQLHKWSKVLTQAS